MTSHEKHLRGPTPPRGWRPGPRYILAAAIGIVLVGYWLYLLASGPSTSVEPLPRTSSVPTAPAK